MNPNTSNLSGLAKLGALHRRFEPEFTEEDELIPNLAGASQNLPEPVEPQAVPSVYDGERKSGHQAAISRGLSALNDYLMNSIESGEPEPAEYAPEGGQFILKPSEKYLHAGYHPQLREYEKNKQERESPKGGGHEFILPPTEYLHGGRLAEQREKDETPAQLSKVGNFSRNSSSNSRQALTPDQIKFYDSSPAAKQSMTPETKALYDKAKSEEVKTFDNTRADNEAKLVPGAVEEMLKDPMAMAQFGEITGIDYTPQLKEALKPYEALAKRATDTLNEEEALIRQRFNEGKMTSQDKIMLGLAIAVPAIMAGIFGGGQAAAGAITGGLGGAAQSLIANQERGIEDRKRLGEIGKERLTIEGSKSDLSKKMKESLPEDSRRTALEGKKTIYFPETGESGIKAGNDALYYNAANLSKGDIKNDLKVMADLAKEGRERMEAVDSLYDVTNDLDNVYSQLMGQGYSSFVPSIAGKIIPGGENWMSAEVKDPKTGKNVKASVLVGQLVEKGLDKYRTSQIGGSRAITEAMRTHFDALLGNPFKLDQALSIADAKNMAESFQNIAAKEFISGMEAEGFLRPPLEQKFLMPIEAKRIASNKKQKMTDQEKQAEETIKKMTPEQLKQFRAGNVVEIG